MMTPQLIFFAWSSILSVAMAISPALNQATLYPTIASQKSLQAQISSIEEKLRNMDEMRTWPSNSRLSDVLRRIDLLDNRIARIEIFLERKMDGLQDKLAYLDGKLETRLDKIQASLDTMSTRSDRGMKLMTNKVVDLERTVQNVKHFCNATARSQAEQLISMQQMQNDGTKGCNGLTQTDSLIDNINKNIAFQIGNVTHKLNNWYSDLWRRSSNLETLLKNENNQSRWEVYDGIMQILSRWDITEESIHEIENNIKERFMDLSSKHKEIIKSISDKENKLAGILDGFLDVLVYNATRALSEFQLTHEMIKSHNSNMGRTVDTTNKLVLSCQEDNKALKGALLQTGAQYKMDWDTKHDKLQANINSTQLHISKIQSLLENFLQESKNNTKDTLEILNKKMTEATNLISSKCTQINETDKYNQGHSNINIELKNITLTTPLSSQNRPNDVSVDAVSEEILSNATQVQNFLSGFKNAIEEVSFNSNVNKSQQNNFHTSDYADSFGPEVQDYDDVEEEYTE